MRMLNALEPGTVVPIHRHSETSEDVICIRGCVEEVLYDAEGKEVARYRLQPGTECLACHVPMDQYHTCISLESGSVIVEFKNGKYDPLTTEIFLNQEL
jgi:cupin fold WbuC family metalloprotein